MADALSAAKGALEHANKMFPSPKTAPAHEYSNAPYSMVSDIKKKLKAPIDAYHKTVSDIEKPGTSQGIEENQEKQKLAPQQQKLAPQQ
jgi:hypothetical protein